ncbi:putative toxin-antitoxin system toxin component, PIN family [Nocardia sp. NPDC048505]|uniref:putative toxin-antitoxin system toxin component, PIN family n=1 Tax=unclassified Nocardia TaxID=2637762 RepID=UPI0033DAB1A1
MRRVVLDTNALISAALSPRGASASLVQAALNRDLTLVVSDKLIYELETRLARSKFRRYLSEEEAERYVDAICLVGQWIVDRPDAEMPLVCRDPDDNFLVALYQDADAHLLVSGDKDVLAISYPNVNICNPRTAIENLSFKHEWGDFLPGGYEDAMASASAEGYKPILDVYSAFATIVNQDDAKHLLPLVVVPETVKSFQRGLRAIRKALKNRGMTTRPHIASPEVAYVKLPPDPGIGLRATDDRELPADTIFATVVRCEDIPDPSGINFDHWRVFGVGAAVPVDEIPPRALRST